MNYNYVSIILIIIFFTSLFYFIYFNKNNIISYQTIKDFKKSDFLNKKFCKRKNCNDYCSKESCDRYHVKLNHYINCLKCQKKLSCYDNLNSECYPCLKFGFNQCIKPINPKNTYCY